jgi:polysaccharide export outer membrane protein
MNRFNLKKYHFILLLGYMFFSCVSKKNIVYLQKDNIDQEKVSNNYITIFKPDDLLEINVTSLENNSSIPFNLFTPIPNSGGGGQVRQLPYLVDNNGFIDFPVLGKIKVAGLTRQELIELLQSRLEPKYLKKPKIYIRIVNFTVNIIGDVRNPGTYTIPNERITIFDALSMAGDLNISARRDNILVVREKDDKKIEYRVDLRSRKLYSSPVFYLQQNDNIYVEPNYASIQSASNNTNTSLFISVTGLLITIVTLILR